MFKILSLIDLINEWVGRIISVFMVVMTVIIVGEVVMRYVFNAPTTWTFETIIMIYGSYFMLSAGYALRHGAHVSIDFIYNAVPERVRILFDLISYTIFFFPFVIVILIEGTKYAAESWAILEHSWSVFGPPLYPFKTVIPVTALLLLLQGGAIFIRNIYKYFGIIMPEKEGSK